MTYETKNITFYIIHVKKSSDSQCSKNFTSECSNRECTLWVVVRGIRAKIGFGQRCVESMIEHDQRQREGGTDGEG